MSAITDALTKLGIENTQAVQTAETLVSGVMSCLSIYTAIGTVATKLLSLWNKNQQSTVPMMESLLRNYVALLERVIQEEIHRHDEAERLRRISDYVNDSRTAADIALKYAANPGAYDIQAAYSLSLAALNKLADDTIYQRHFTPAMLFDMWLYNGIWDLNNHMDPGGRWEFRPPDANWDYRYALPALLEAIAAHLIVIKILEPDTYLNTHRDTLLRISDFLLGVHNKIQLSILTIVPPRHEVTRVNYLGQIPQNRVYGWWGYKVGTRYVPLRLGEGDLNMLTRPFGAVDTYSHIYSIGMYPEYELHPDPHNPSNFDVALRHFFTRFYAHTLKHKMAVYESIGLPAVWKTMAELKAMIGDQVPRLPEDLHGWSLRTVANTISPQGVYQPSADAAISVRELMGVLGGRDPICCRGTLEEGIV